MDKHGINCPKYGIDDRLQYGFLEQITYRIIDRWLDGENEWHYRVTCDVWLSESEISQVISADVVKRKRGKWERDKNNGLLYCPFCDSVAPSEDQYGETILRPPFCHRCGADLREDEDG